MFKQTRTRFAPSPTGYMHIGNLRTALYSYLIAKIHDGKFILRIEDTDQERYVDGAIDIIYKTLKMAGISHDEGPDVGGNYGPYIQSQRKGIYAKYAKQLIDQGDAFRCFCSKERLSQIKEYNIGHGLPNKYDGHCLTLSKHQIEQKLRDNQPYVIRQKIPDEGITEFNDVIYGSIPMENNLMDNQVLLKSDQMPTYNFANVIDDHLMSISHVVRGSEYLSSTPKYNLIYKNFGWDIPTYIHLPPVMKNASEKLSKRNGDAAFEDLVKKGYLPEAILNYIALLGWSPGTTQEKFSLEDLEHIFAIEGISKSPSIFDINKLNWLNGEYIHQMPQEMFNQLALPYYLDAIPNANVDYMKVSELLQSRVNVLKDIPKQIDFFDKLPEYDVSLFVNKKMKCTLESARTSLIQSIDVLMKISEWNQQNIHDRLLKLVEDLSLKNGQILWPIRVAVTGKQFTPGGAVEIAAILGKEETLSRINMGISKLKH